MKRRFSLSGLLLGLLTALVVGLVTTHVIGWLPVGLVVGVAVVAACVKGSGSRRKEVDTMKVRAQTEGR